MDLAKTLFDILRKWEMVVGLYGLLVDDLLLVRCDNEAHSTFFVDLHGIDVLLEVLVVLILLLHQQVQLLFSLGILNLARRYFPSV